MKEPGGTKTQSRSIFRTQFNSIDNLGRHVARHINLIGQLGHVDLETALNLGQYLLILLAGDERDGNTLGTETTGTAHAVEELVGVIGEVVVDDDVDTLNVNTTAEQIGRYENSGVEVLEGLVLGNTLVLLHAGMDADGGEVALGEEAVELVGAGNLGNEDDNLVELQNIEEVVELAVLLGLGKLDVVQLQTVEGELGVVVDVDLHGVLAELAADRADLLAQGGGEHHDLLLVGGHAEDLLDVAAHFQGFQDAIALVEDEMLDVIELEGLLLGKAEDAAGSTDDDVGAVVLEDVTVGLDGDTAIEDGGLDLGKVLGEALVLVGDLEGKLPSVANDQDGNLVLTGGEGAGVELVQSGQDEDGRLTHTGLGLANDVHAEDGLGDALVLDLGGVLETAIDDGAEAFGLEDKILETGGMDAYIVTSAQIRSTQRRGRKRVGWDIEKREVNVGCRSVEVGHCRRHGGGEVSQPGRFGG